MRKPDEAFPSRLTASRAANGNRVRGSPPLPLKRSLSPAWGGRETGRGDSEGTAREAP